MNPYDPIAHTLSINRRSFLTKSAYGLGGAAFAMLAARGLAAPAPITPKGWSRGALRSAGAHRRLDRPCAAREGAVVQQVPEAEQGREWAGDRRARAE